MACQALTLFVLSTLCGGAVASQALTLFILSTLRMSNTSVTGVLIRDLDHIIRHFTDTSGTIHLM